MEIIHSFRIIEIKKWPKQFSKESIWSIHVIQTICCKQFRNVNHLIGSSLNKFNFSIFGRSIRRFKINRTSFRFIRYHSISYFVNQKTKTKYNRRLQCNWNKLQRTKNMEREREKGKKFLNQNNKLWYCLQMFGRWNRLFVRSLSLVSFLANCSVYSWARRKCKENKAIKCRKMPFCGNCRLLLVAGLPERLCGMCTRIENRELESKKREKN